MRAVAATGYAGLVSLEIFNDQFRGGAPRAISVDGQRALRCLMDDVRRSEPDLALDVSVLPERRVLEGVEFIEFATGPEGAAPLEAMLRSYGFRRTARHISKEVSLWRQGGVDLIVNREEECFPDGGFSCHLGLRVDDARAAMDRALALGAEPFDERTGPDELSIPAIRGVGGGLLYFIDGTPELSRWREVDFRPVEDGEEDAAFAFAGLVRVDHVALTMPAEDLPTWALFHTTLFRALKTPVVDMVDPAGLVRSQAVESVDGGLRLTLNGAENGRTLAERFISGPTGATVQHVAFLTEDIFAAAEALRANGFRPLAISRNYYDDLEARLGLEPAFSDRLREHNILFDRSEKGDYLQMYGPVHGELV